MKRRLLSLLLAVCMVATLFSGLTVNASAGVVDDILYYAAKAALSKYLDSELLDELDLETLDVSAILSAAANSNTSGVFGAEGNNLSWNFDSSSGVLSITGSGEMEDFDFAAGDLAPWWNLGNVLNIKRVEIADTVTRIGEFAFCALPHVTVVTLPAGLTALPRYALAACNDLAFPTLPETLEEIGAYALAACDTFTAIALPASVQRVGSHAFAGCDGLRTVTVPETVQSLGSYAFSSCDTLAKATLPATVTAVPAGCFFNCESLLSVTYNGTMTAIGERAFYGCKVLTEAPIPETVAAIGDYAFGNCKALGSVTLPEGLGTLGTGAFSSCELLTAIALPDAITVVPEDCFSACGLTDVTLAPATTEIGAGAFTLCILLPGIDLPGTLTAIGESAFSGCEKLAELTLPAGLQTIGASAFLGCAALTTLDVPGSVADIGESAFSNCTALTKVTFRAGADAQTIGGSAFALCTALENAWFYGNAPAVTAADETGATFVKNTIYIHYPAENGTWVVTDGLWCGYKATPWSACRHDADGFTLTQGETIAPTCTTKGYTIYTCDNCGEVLHRDETELIPHDLQPVVVEPTCTESGYTKYVCKDCGYEDPSKRTNYIAPTGHTYELTEITVEPTCTEAGQGVYTCTVCGYAESRPIAATGHTPVTVVVDPTCTESGYTTHVCAVCGVELGLHENETAALGHSWDGGQVVTPATATREGLTRYTCTRCGATKDVAIPALGVTACQGGADCPQAKFTDKRAPGYWSHEAIDYCLENGILNGVSETKFSPAATTTRGQLVTMLYRMQGRPEKYELYYVPFTDVEPGAYYYAAVAWAYENGIVNGMGNGTFQPNAPVTREQMALIMMNYTARCVGAVTGSADLSTFPDAAVVSSWARSAVSWAVANGIISGVAENTGTYLRPRGSATREQVAAILMRFEQNIANR